MNVTLEMLGLFLGLLTLALGFGRFLSTMRADIVKEIASVSAQNAAFRLEQTEKVHEVQLAHTELKGEVKRLGERLDEVS